MRRSGWAAEEAAAEPSEDVCASLPRQTQLLSDCLNFELYADAATLHKHCKVGRAMAPLKDQCVARDTRKTEFNIAFVCSFVRSFSFLSSLFVPKGFEEWKEPFPKCAPPSH